jgi:hypothetical protein
MALVGVAAASRSTQGLLHVSASRGHRRRDRSTQARCRGRCLVGERLGSAEATAAAAAAARESTRPHACRVGGIASGSRRWFSVVADALLH